MEDLALSGDLRAFWRKRRVFLTGHTGFKGSWLSTFLQVLGAETTGYALAPEGSPCLFDDARVATNMRSVIGDVLDGEALRRALVEAGAEVVIHMAAQPLVRRSYAEPVSTFATNLLGTVHLLEAVRRVPTARVVLVVTTDKCYENREWAWGYRETDALGGRDPYSASKACAELATAAYRRSFFAPGVAVATARAGNVIGGGDWSEDRIIPDIVRSVIEKRAAVIRAPKAVRPWQHVLDPLFGYLVLARHLWSRPEAAGAYNFGPPQPESMTVRELARCFVRELGRGQLEEEPARGQRLHEARQLRLDCSKTQAILGFRPRLDTRSSISLAAQWYAAFLENPDTAAVVLRRQIDDYMTRIGDYEDSVGNGSNRLHRLGLGAPTLR